MKSRRLFFALFRYNAQLLPPNGWFLASIILLFSLALIVIDFQFRHGSSALGGTSISDRFNGWLLVFCSQFGLLYFGAGAMPWTQPFALIPGGEFLLVRPVSRRTAYLARIALYFLIMISGSLLKVGASLPDPDLPLYLSLGKTSTNEVTEHLALYREQFPESSVIHQAGAYHDTLVIPSGAAWTALWELFLTFFFAVALQATMVLALPPKVQMALLIAVSQTPLLLIVLNLSGKHTMLMEYAFFFFAHHWIFILLLALGIFVLVQSMALKRIQALEII
jgi:hypothetical protein